ncbi:hypothetical protein L210DRAFT_3642808 [Boletus edulis BED1]|uniref:PH domain-containing protein n=1 Tax=Boletus edulis BED1 TaxID=1328754 RepID=A0AAD4C0I3_BOLED|nr:hypothetical protein L210DRAFT_3642808 [Boletus edulis BED1]
MSTVFPMSSPMSRTSATNTEPPRTPANEFHALPASRSGVGGPRKMDDTYYSMRLHSGAYNTSTLGQAGEHGDFAAHRPRISIDQVPSPGYTPALRRQSTKQLIHRFESMTDAGEMVQVVVKRPSGSTRPSSENDSRDMLRPFLTTTSHKSKRRSLSNSLRNFMSVFKKKKDKESDDDDYAPLCHASELNIAAPLEPASLPKPQMVSRLCLLEKEIPPSSNKAGSALSGSLLYLSRPPSHPPVWISCTVTLYDSHLLLTWYTMHETPSSCTIQLDRFMDVHSLNERAPRPDTEGDLKTFELTFEGRQRETFAATSSQERARWVGAIWDAVLNSQGRNEPVHTSKRSETLTIRTDVSHEHKEIGQSLQSPGEAHSEYTSSSGQRTPLANLLCNKRRRPHQLPSHHVTHFLHCLSLHLVPRLNSPTLILGPKALLSPILERCLWSRSASPRSSARSLQARRRVPVSSSSVGTALRRAQTNQLTHQGRPFAEIEKLQEEENAGGSWSKAIETPSTDASIVIPLPNPPNVPLSDTHSVRSAFRRNRTERQSSPAPTPPSSPTKASSSLAAPATTLRAKLSEPAIRQHVENPPTSLLAVGVEPQLAPLAELIKDTAAKHYDQTAGLGEQIISLQRDLQILPNEIQVLLGHTVDAVVKQLSDSNNHTDSASLQNVLTTLEGLRKQILENSEHPRMDSLTRMFDSLQTRLATLAPLLMEKLVSIEQGQTQLRLQAIRAAEQPPMRVRTTRDVPGSPRPSSPTESGSRSQDGSRQASVDLSDIRSKLDELESLLRSSTVPVSTGNIPPSQTAGADSEMLQAILDHLRLDEEQRKLQLDQQADSVRYLNELNSWLESFVNGGTVHIQSVAANVEQLCSYLGTSSESDTPGGQSSNQGMLGEIRHLISSVQTKALGEGQLQASIDELMNTVREQMKNGTEQRAALVTESVLEIIHRQRHEQEQMLRVLSTELTNEIRGERLRFVEAMKEATAINVQAHVEHFKAELGREVAAMTQDVGKLHQEKQAIEQQIADLFAFYSKQKQEAEVRSSYAEYNGPAVTLPSFNPQNNARRNATPKSAGFSNLQNLPASTSRRPRRPLPHPVFQRK